MKIDTISRALQKDFEPRNEDILSIRCKTIGITHCEFIYQGVFYDVIDVGGQQNERRKWKNCKLKNLKI